MPFGMKNIMNDYNFFLHKVIRMSLEGYYVCGHCNYKTKSQKDITEHDKTPSHLEHFKHTYCQSCDLQCWSKVKFNQHCETSKHKITANVRMECKHCEYTTNNQLLMARHEQSQRHKNAVNGVVKELLVCEKCDYKTKFKSQFKQHEETEKHQNNIRGIVKPNEYVCSECNYITHIKCSMDLHKKTKKHIANQTKL